MDFLSQHNCQIAISQSYDPFFNLSLERFLFDQLKPNDYILLLWRSYPSVIMGRFQNPWLEINTTRARAEQIQIVRRISGGGCVYHDLGNLNYCFLSYGDTWKRKEHCEFIANVLANWSLKAHVSDKFDVLIEHPEGLKKISGSAFKQSRQKHLHHGTLLVNADLARLRALLKPEQKHISSKSIASRPHSVCNLQELNDSLDILALQQGLIENFCRFSGKDLAQSFYGPEMLPLLQTHINELESTKWLWGETPYFEQKIPFEFDWGQGELNLVSHKALIKQIEIDCDFFHPDTFDSLEAKLVGQDYHDATFTSFFSDLAANHPHYQKELLQLAEIVRVNVT